MVAAFFDRSTVPAVFKLPANTAFATAIPPLVLMEAAAVALEASVASSAATRPPMNTFLAIDAPPLVLIEAADVLLVESVVLVVVKSPVALIVDAVDTAAPVNVTLSTSTAALVEEMTMLPLAPPCVMVAELSGRVIPPVTDKPPAVTVAPDAVTVRPPAVIVAPPAVTVRPPAVMVVAPFAPTLNAAVPPALDFASMRL